MCGTADGGQASSMYPEGGVLGKKQERYRQRGNTTKQNIKTQRGRGRRTEIRSAIESEREGEIEKRERERVGQRGRARSRRRRRRRRRRRSKTTRKCETVRMGNNAQLGYPSETKHGG